MDSTNDKENDKTTILDTQFTQEETQMLAGPSQTKPAGRHEPREPRTLPLTFYWMSRDNGPPLRDAVLKLTDQHFLILVEGHGMERFDLSRVRDIAVSLVLSFIPSKSASLRITLHQLVLTRLDPASLCIYFHLIKACQTVLCYLPCSTLNTPERVCSDR